MIRLGEEVANALGEGHAVVALEDSVAIDIFNPPRQDWIDGDDAYLRG